MGLKVRIAALWGFFEATLFFIVPDVFLTYLATQKNQPLKPAIVASTVGALAGGCLMFVMGAYYYESSYQLLLSIPAIDSLMIQKVQQLIESQGLLGLFVGPLVGIPYKIFAVESANLSLSPLLFLLISIPARCLRFILLSYFTKWVTNLLFQTMNRTRVVFLWGIIWLMFYSFYFYYFGF
ncbi:hypothetical protein [Pleionea sediminis]|uniref:hypothetical protein n=1 Tax=Pleionea sediminis TaxID=2569479 RepID=UPI001185D607|nr:hypothetical protein [Pleionea sediminis]